MFKKQKHLDVMFSTFFIFFAVSVTLGILTYTEFSNAGMVVDYYFLLSYTIVMGIVSLYYFILYLLCINHQRNDYVIDFETETIQLSKRKSIHFKDIKLVGHRPNRDEIKIFYGINILNIITSQLKDEFGEDLSYEKAKEIGKYAFHVDHKHLYNYSFMSLYETQFVFFFYAMFKTKLPIFSDNENMLVVFTAMVIVQTIVFLSNSIRLEILFRNREERQDITEDTK